KAALGPFLSSANSQNLIPPSRPILHAGFMLRPARLGAGQPPARGDQPARPAQPPATPERPPTRTSDFPRQPTPGTTNAGPNVPSVRVLVELTQGSSTPRIVAGTDVSAAEGTRDRR